uniref:Mitochondrial carrier protein n=1 Tax=Syphacia muris TaxID=451379 RepID=A0A0N5APK0_9BILA
MERTKQQKDFLCGCGAGFVETTILYPQSKLIFRQQLCGFGAKAALTQLRSEGIRHLYRGLLPPLLMRSASRALMFGMYEKWRSFLCCVESPVYSSFTLCHAEAAFLAGSCEALLCPLERTQVILQCPKYHNRFRNTAHAMRDLACMGTKELYRGFSIIIFRNGFSNSLFFTMREPLRKKILLLDKEYSLHSKKFSDRFPLPVIHFCADFCSGALLGACISTLFFPVNVVKNQMQSTVQTKFQSSWKIFFIVLKERGSFSGLYRGVGLNFTRSIAENLCHRSLLAWGITNSVYEFLRERRFWRTIE